MKILIFFFVLVVSHSVNAQWDSIRPRFYVKPTLHRAVAGFTVVSPYSLWDRSTYSPINLELGTLTQYGIAAFETTGGISGSAGFNLPIRKTDSRWLRQIGVNFGNSGYVNGYASGSKTDRTTIDSITVQSSGEKLPVDSVSQTFIRSSYSMSFDFIGLEYNFLYKKSDRALIGFGLETGYLFSKVFIVETDKFSTISYEPKVKPDEPGITHSGEYTAYLKSSLFNVSLPVSASILLNNPKRESKVYSAYYVYAGLQFKPTYWVGGFNNTTVSQFSMQFQLSLNFLFSFKARNQAKTKAVSTNYGGDYTKRI